MNQLFTNIKKHKPNSKKLNIIDKILLFLQFITNI